MKRIVLLYALLPLVVACGYTSSGDGSDTLEVRLEANYDANDNDMRIRVEVRKFGEHLPGATVQVRDDKAGDVLTLAEQTDRYQTNIQRYARRLELQVSSGDDFVDGKLEGPGRHTIDEPVNADVLSRSDLGDHLKVRWSTNDGIRADQVRVRISRAENTLDDDTGSFDVETALLDTGDHDLEVERQNRVDLSGGIGASFMEIAYQVHQDITITD